MVNLSVLYTFLFALTIISINPWGSLRGEIWTQPKLLAIDLVTALNILVILHPRWRGLLAITPVWKVGLSLWLLFLGVGLAASLLSPFPWRSLWGQSTLGDGWFYWVLIAAFVLSNALVLQLEPGLFRPQLYGLLAGGVIIALSIFPQVFDWRIDYTATSGEVSLFNPQVLESTIWKKQMPIGLYSNRGYTAFVLAAVGVLTLLGAFWGWVRTIPAIVLSVLFCIALFCTQTRAGLLALLVATVYLLLRFYFKSARRWLVLHYKIVLLLFCCLILFTYLVLKATVTLPTVEVRQLLSPDNLEKFSTGRLHLWELSLRGIVERPLLGWGFDGFSIAFPFIADWTGRHRGYLLEKVPVAQVLRLDTSTFDYLGTDGKLHTGVILTTKAHNLFLDTILSVGILGLLLYLLLFGLSLWCVAKTTFQGVEAVGIGYLVYTLTWFESAQFSHIAWWALSAGFASVLKNKGHSNCEANNFARHNENG